MQVIFISIASAMFFFVGALISSLAASFESEERERRHECIDNDVTFEEFKFGKEG